MRPPRQDDYGFLTSRVRPSYEHGDDAIAIVDLFSGCGGMALGVAHAAHSIGRAARIPLAIDIDKGAVDVFRQNFPTAGCILDDVRDWFAPAFNAPLTESERKIRDRVGTGIDFLVGGPPCQGNSNLNNHTRRNDPRNALYARMARAARVLEPRIVIVENVPNVLNDQGNVVDATASALESEGYEVAGSVLNLRHIGLPQTRKRHVLLGSADQNVIPEDILATLRDVSGYEERDVRWAIADLEDVVAESGFDRASNPSPENARRIHWLFENDEYDLPNRLRPPCHQNDSHTYGSIYGRLRWDRPAQTVTTGFNSIGQGRNIHPSRHRTITPHEAARLQLIPDFFEFGAVNTRGAWARLLGNAVPPLLTMRIAEHVLGSGSALESSVRSDFVSQPYLFRAG